METFEVETEARLAARDVTDRVEACIPSGADGAATVFVRHTTAGVCVNEAEARLLDDLAGALDELVPDEGWKHDELDGNADAHVRAMLVGNGPSLPVVDGALALGTWQSVLLIECDGPRTRTVSVVPS